MHDTLKLIDNKILTAAETLWNYMLLGHVLKQVDVMLVFGSRDERVAVWAAKLYKRGTTKRILISGGAAHKNDLLGTQWHEKTEAEHFARLMIVGGVPASAIILETNAQSTGENVLLSYESLMKHNIEPKSLLIVHKPYMERRAYATFMKQWPGQKNKTIVTSPPLGFNQYFNKDQSFDTAVSIMVGDMQRIIEYPRQGYQIPQEVPEDVYRAYEFLIKNGYDKYLLQR